MTRCGLQHGGAATGFVAENVGSLAQGFGEQLFAEFAWEVPQSVAQLLQAVDLDDDVR